jgi:hypothetical protein
MLRAQFARIFNAIHGHGLFVQRFNAVTKVPQIDPLVRMAACQRYIA